MSDQIQEKWKYKLFAYMASQGISLLGSTIVSFAVMWYVTLKTQSAMAVVGITITTFLPQALVMLFGGVLADRYCPKRIVMIADSFIAFSTLLLGILFLNGIDSIGWIFFFNCLRSLGTGIQMPAIKSMLPLFIPEGQYMRANSIYTSIWCVIQLVSPGLSGVLMSIMKMEYVFFVDVGTAVIGIVLLSTITMPIRMGQAVSENPKEELRQGFQYILNSKPLKNCIILYSVFQFLVVPASQLTPLLATHNIGNEVWVLSVIETAFSVGALVISLFMSYKKLSASHFKLIGFSAILFGTMMILLIPSHNIFLFAVFMLIMGVGSPLYYTPLTTHIQEITEEEYLGRTFSYVDLFSSLATPLGMIVFGPLSKISIVLPFAIPGVLLILLGVKTRKAT